MPIVFDEVVGEIDARAGPGHRPRRPSRPPVAISRSAR